MFRFRFLHTNERGFFASIVTSLFVLAASLSGCAVTEVSSARNEPLAMREFAPPRDPQEPPTVGARHTRHGKPFVGLAISGGGSRAAVFSWSVLEKLAQLGILEHVDAISSVSGGSLAAATYVLSADQLHRADDWALIRNRLGQDLLTPWLGKLANPLNWGKMLTSDLERTHLMAEVFENRFFHGATFATLERRTNGPILLLNSTLASGKNAGDPFVFSYRSFADIGSRLDTYPISHAVMASGAFPGVFGNITLRVFNDENQRGQPVPTYVRVFDGGVADNLGLYTLLDVARETYDAPMSRLAPMPGCLLISIDAGTPNLDGEMKALMPDTDNSLFDLIIKGTAWDAINGMMNINRSATLQEFSQYARRGQMRLTSPRIIMPMVGQLTDIPQTEELLDPVSSFPLFGPRASGQQDWAAPLFTPTDLVRPSKSGSFTEQEVEQLMLAQRQWQSSAPQCKLWHINFERLRAMDSYVFKDGRSYTQKADTPAAAYKFKLPPMTVKTSPDGTVTQFLQESEISTPLFSDTRNLNEREFNQLASINGFRASLWGFVSQVGTSYRLTGVPHCGPELISQQLATAADLLVNEDRSALQQVLTWFRGMGLPVVEPVAARSRNMVAMPRIKTILLATRRVGTIPLSECVR
ncbi:patatin-like phospholipase family protein [Massilia pseudoviolaceinigra]|uniref:patatin-like phospholipase family protein n=1 Tax=Massilia pseudoviolaceinigra TaxID=3057165 RepID=UPI0027968B8D|nr:patatin-like phospholipase family protein [Massilia sp. CCM 9206]MDQ1924823.1 patatin-like phospholipase family protein [Massilia sp. CCM 9206]